MAPKLLLVSLLLAGTVLAVQSQLEPTRRIRFRPKIRRTNPAPAPEDNAIGGDLNLSKDEAKSLINKLKQSSSRRTDLPPRRPGFNANKRTRFRRPQKIPLGRSRFTEATPAVETTTERKRDQFVPSRRNKNPSVPERPFKGQVIGGEITLDSGIRSPNEQIEVVKFKPTEASLSQSNPGFEAPLSRSHPGFEAEPLEVEGSGVSPPQKDSLFKSLSQEREEFRERNEERDRLEIALATEQPFENSIDTQTTERHRSFFKRPSDRAGVLPIRKAAKRRRGRPGAKPTVDAEARPVSSPVSRPAPSPVSRPAPSPVSRPAPISVSRPAKRPVAPATEATFTPSIITEARNTVSTEDPLEALLRRASSLTSSEKDETTERVVEQPRNNEENEITDRRIGVRRRIPGRLGTRKNIKSGRRKASSSKDFIKQDRLRLRSRARVPIKRPAANSVESENSISDEDNAISRTRLTFRRPISNTINEQDSTPEGPNFSSFPSKSSSGSSKRPAFQPRIRVSQSQAPEPEKETVFRPSQDIQNIQTESIGSIGTIPITEAFSQTIPATEAFRDETVISTSKPQPTTPFREEQIRLRTEPTRAQPTARPPPRVQPTARPQPSRAEPRPRTTINRPFSSQLQSLGPNQELEFQIPLEFDPFSLTTPGTPAVADFTRRPFSSARATTPAPPRRVTQRPRTVPESPRSVQAVPDQQRAPVETPRQFTNFGQSGSTQQVSAPRRLPVPAQAQPPRRNPGPSQAQAPRRLPVPAQAQPPRRNPVPAQPQAPQRLPVPSQPQTPQRLSFPAQPQAPRRLPVPAPPQAPQSAPAPAAPQAPSQAAVPAPSAVSGITQLRNNNFAAFDRQFGGAVPFTAFRNTGSQQAAAPQRVSANRFAQPNIALLQNQNTLIQPQNSFQATPLQRPQTQSNPATSGVIQRLTPGIQQPQRVVPQNFQFPFQTQDQTFSIAGGQQSFQRFSPQQPFRFQAAAESQNVQSFASRPQNVQSFAPQFQSRPPQQQQQQLQFQAAASQNVPVAVRQPLNLPADTFFGHPAQNINLNTGSFSISTK